MTADTMDFLTVQGSDLRVFVPSEPTRATDNPLVAIFREVQNLRTLEQVSRGTRMETAQADQSTTKMANAVLAARETGNTGRTV